MRLPVVLVVEDVQDTRDLWVLAFQDAGFRVLSADSMAAGFATLRSEEHIDVVVCDYWLGDGSGEILLRQARADGTLGNARAVLCTAYVSVTDSAQAAVLHKPISPDDLIAHVKELLPDFGGSPAVA